MKLPEFSVNRRVSTTMIVLILVVVGLISFSRLGLDYFPDIEYPTVSVITNYKGASSEDIENTITRLLEQVVNSVNKVRKVTSPELGGRLGRPGRVRVGHQPRLRRPGHARPDQGSTATTCPRTPTIPWWSSSASARCPS